MDLFIWHGPCQLTQERVGQETPVKAGRHCGHPGGEGVGPAPGEADLLPDGQGGQGVVAQVEPGGEVGREGLELRGSNSEHDSEHTECATLPYLYTDTKSKSKHWQVPANTCNTLIVMTRPAQYQVSGEGDLE